MPVPAASERRVITLDMPVELITYLDQQADYHGMSRSAYVRGLVVKDLERQGLGRQRSA